MLQTTFEGGEVKEQESLGLVLLGWSTSRQQQAIKSWAQSMSARRMISRFLPMHAQQQPYVLLLGTTQPHCNSELIIEDTHIA